MRMADPESPEPQRDPHPPTGPYTVEPVTTACTHCGAGETWVVRGPVLPEWAIGNKWYSKDDALMDAGAWNAIFEAGQRSVTSKGDPRG